MRITLIVLFCITALGCDSAQMLHVSAAKAAVMETAKDPNSLQYKRNYVHMGEDGITHVCLEVNGKNSFGAYTGFKKVVWSSSETKPGGTLRWENELGTEDQLMPGWTARYIAKWCKEAA